MNTVHSTEEDSSYTCRDCSFQTNNREHLLQHLEKNHSKYICNKCNKSLNSKNKMNQHIIEKHPSYKPCRDYATNSCEYNEECRYKHIKLRDNQHICYTCGVMTATVKDIMTHIKEVHGSEPCTRYEKGICDRNNKCWYSHSRTAESTTTQDTPVIEEEDFQEVPTTRRLFIQVVGTRSSPPKVNQVPEETHRQKIYQLTHSVLTQLMPSIMEEILKSLQK